MLVLSTESAKFFAPNEPLFGKEFQTKFSSSGFELEEASKCMALGRSTAAVFHLMEPMEIGLNATAKCLRIPPPTGGGDRNWGRILQKIKTEMKSKARTSNWMVGCHR